MANFQTALDALRRGERVARRGWKSGFLFLACGLDFYTTADLSGVYKKTGGECNGSTEPTWHYDCGPAWKREAICFCPNNPERGELAIGWLPGFNDLFATDWEVHEYEKTEMPDNKQKVDYEVKCAKDEISCGRSVEVDDPVILKILNILSRNI